jgi:putative transcriptional regulator
MTGPIRKGHVSNRIRMLREAAGMTQAELAGRVNASRQTVIAIEAEKYAPSLELAFRLARCLEAPFEEVFSYAD